MTTYNTGNPIGSKDPRDLYDNAENLDAAVNSLSGTWKDRFGRTRPTVAGAIDPTGVVQAAANEANRAEAAAASVKPYVDSALSDLSTAANKFYPTLALANADIANIEVNQPVHVGSVTNGGLWYKATSEATTLTKSAYDPVEAAKSNTIALLSTKLTTTTNLDDLPTGAYYITSPDMNTIYDNGTYIALGYPADMARGGGAVVEVTRSKGNGTLSFQTITFTRQGVIFTRDGQVGASFNEWLKTAGGGGGGGGYETVALGLASVEDGDTFWVYPNSSNNLEQLTLYVRIDETTANTVYTQTNPLDEYLINEGDNWEIAQ